VPTAHYDTLTAGRAHFKDLLDAAEAGRPASVRRDSRRSAVVDAERLRYALTQMCPSRAEMAAEGGGWSIFMPGLPLAADGATVDEALDEMVDVLREYAEDWADHLLHARNHADNWGLVQIIELSDDQQLKDWLVGQ
jgi:predicted RNase H-like HicB family nuclease